jgi:hypothetical protein
MVLLDPQDLLVLLEIQGLLDLQAELDHLDSLDLVVHPAQLAEVELPAALVCQALLDLQDHEVLMVHLDELEILDVMDPQVALDLLENLVVQNKEFQDPQVHQAHLDLVVQVVQTSAQEATMEDANIIA